MSQICRNLQPESDQKQKRESDTMARKEKEKLHYGYIIVVCCCLIMGFDVGISMSCAGIFYTPVSKALGVEVGTFSLYMSFSFLTSALMLSVAGKMLQKYSARWLLTINSALLGVIIAGMGCLNAVWEFYILGALMGMTLAFLLYLSFPTLLNRWFNARLGFFIGICSAASGIGGILLNPVGAYLITGYSWRGAYWIFGLFILIIVTPVLGWLIRDYPKEKGLLPFGLKKSDEVSTADAEGVPYKSAVRMASFYALIVFGFLIMAVSTLNLFIPSYVTNIGFSLSQSALAASAIMAGVTIGKVALGFINDKSSVLGVIVMSACGVGGILLLIFGHISIFTILGGAFLFGWAYAGVTVQTAMLVRTVFGNRDYSRIFSIISMALAAGGAVSAGGWGLLADATSTDFIFITGLVFLGICCFIGLWSLWARTGYKTRGKASY